MYLNTMKPSGISPLLTLQPPPSLLKKLKVYINQRKGNTLVAIPTGTSGNLFCFLHKAWLSLEPVSKEVFPCPFFKFHTQMLPSNLAGYKLFICHSYVLCLQFWTINKGMCLHLLINFALFCGGDSDCYVYFEKIQEWGTLLHHAPFKPLEEQRGGGDRGETAAEVSPSLHENSHQMVTSINKLKINSNSKYMKFGQSQISPKSYNTSF